MRVFADLEFSSLTEETEFISIGAVSEDGDCFYKEVEPLPLHCSGFVLKEVLPHLARGATAAPLQEIEVEFSAWLSQWSSTQIVVDSDWDCFVLRKAFAQGKSFEAGELRLRMSNGDFLNTQITLDDSFERLRPEPYLEAKRSFESSPGFRKHHALDDAKALRCAVLATEAAFK